MVADKEIHLVFHGRPKVQKNDLVIRYKQVKGRKIPFIGHSTKMSDIRDAMTVEFYKQYKAQGFTKPIDYLFEIDMVFYMTTQSEPDLDNLPAIVLDALQGLKVKKSKIKVAVTLTDDKLLRRESSRKIVKGDNDYTGEPRTEIRIRPYRSEHGDRTPVTTTQGGDKARPQRAKKKV